MKKWTQIRDSWMKSVKKQKNEKRSGSSVKPSRLYLYHNQMCFLKKITGSIFAQESTDDNTINDESGGREIEESEKNRTVLKSSVNQPSTGAFGTQKKRKSETMHELDVKMLKFIDHQMHNVPRNEENRHLSFFKGLLLSMSSLNEDQTLEFQAGVISLLQRIKKNTSQYAYHTHYGTQNQFSTPLPMQHNYQWPNSEHYPQPPQQSQLLLNKKTVHPSMVSPDFESATSPPESVMSITSKDFKEYTFADLT